MGQYCCLLLFICCTFARERLTLILAFEVVLYVIEHHKWCFYKGNIFVDFDHVFVCSFIIIKTFVKMVEGDKRREGDFFFSDLKYDLRLPQSISPCVCQKIATRHYRMIFSHSFDVKQIFLADVCWQLFEIFVLQFYSKKQPSIL